MTMKKPQLEKAKGKKITGGGYGASGGRYGRGSGDGGQGQAKTGKDALSGVTAGLLGKWLKSK